jgi:Spy/CpxP family protein refolding chaperone
MPALLKPAFALTLTLTLALSPLPAALARDAADGKPAAEAPKKPAGEGEIRKKPPVGEGEFRKKPPVGEGDARKPGFDGHGPAEMLLKALEQLKLSEEQQKKVKAILEEGRAQMEAYRKENAEKFKALYQELQAAKEAQNRDAFRTASEKLRELMEKGPGRQVIMKKIMEVLDPEQQKKLEAMLAKMRDRMRDGVGEGEGKKKGPPSGDRKPGGNTPPNAKKPSDDSDPFAF